MTHELRRGKGWLSKLKASSAKGQGEVARRAGRIEFDPLEPRMLMSADPLVVNLALLQSMSAHHDVVVQLVESASAASATPATSVQVVDRTQSNLVLAIGDLTTISSVDVLSGPGANTITIDAGVVGGHSLPQISVSGGGTSTALVIDDNSAPGATPETWTLSGPSSGVATGAVNVGFSNVQTLIGSGADVLAGPAADTTWNVTGAGAGNISDGVAFAGFNKLIGAANNRDSFAFAPGGFLAGGIDGGAGGFDTLVLQGAHRSFEMIAADAHSGAVVLDGQSMPYAGLEPITNTGTTADVVIDLPPLLFDTATLTGSGGQMTITSGHGTFETTTFADPTGSLTIKLQQDGDIVSVNSIDPGFAAGLTIDSGDPTGPSPPFIPFFDPGVTGAVSLNASVFTSGHDLKINAGTISVASGVTINTQSSTGASGNVDLIGRNITILSGAVIDATASSSAVSAGTVTITASWQNYRLVELPVDYSKKSISINLTGATIRGGDVNIEATASDISLASDLPAYAAGFTSTLTNLFAQAPGALFSGATGIDLSAVLRGADAAISVDSANIVSSGSVTIKSNTTAETLVNAIDISNNAAGFGIAAGYGQATSSATAVVTGTSQINAAKNVTVNATGSVSVKSTSRASANLIGNVSQTAQSYAIALAYTNLNATAETDAGTRIKAGNNVSITATGSDNNTTSAATAGFVDVAAGNTVALGVDFSNVRASLNGSVSAGGTVKGAPGPTFDATTPATIDSTANSLYLPNHGLKTGQTITYNAYTASGAPATPVAGLTNGATYYVIALDANHIQLVNAPTLTLDPSQTDKNAIQSLSVANALAFNTAAVGVTAGVSVLNLTTIAAIKNGATVFARDNVIVSAEDQTMPIRLRQTPTRCRVDPFSGIELGIGRRLDAAGNAEQ
jgi:hypothetical protein